MANRDIPAEAPPSYTDATAASSSSQSLPDPSRLQVPGQEQNGIPTAYRRSMEDETRPLPTGWVRQFDSNEQHQYFVDTSKEPPRSIWVHPHDDEEYLSTLPSAEREAIEEQSFSHGHRPSREDIMASQTDDDEELPAHAPPQRTTPAANQPPAELPPRPTGENSAAAKDKDARTLGRKVKDKLTGTTHTERATARQQRAEHERQLYHQHMAVRQAMVTAARTGQAQRIGRDDQGRDIYVEPPPPRATMMGGGGGMRGGYPGAMMGGGGMGYNPYGAGGVYSTPNARYVRPAGPYGRPAGRGFGGGYGLPLALGGGLLGGALLGDMMF